MDTATRIEMYRMMVESRLFEKRVHDLFLQGLVKGTSHLALGQEAVAAGFAAAIEPDDLVFCTYRGHVHTLSARRADGRVAGRAAGPGHRGLRGQGRVDAPDRRVEGGHGVLRHRRRPPADRRRCGLGRPGAGQRPGRGVLLRRRRHQHRRVPRGAQPGRGVEAAGRVRVREQPLHGVHADRLGHGRRQPRRRPGRGLRARAHRGRRQRPRRGPRRRAAECWLGPATGERPVAGRGADVPPRAATRGPTRASTGPTTRWPSWLARDPIPMYRDRLASMPASTRPRSTPSTSEAAELVDEATEEAKAAPVPDASMLETELWADGGSAWRN